jgi:uncharacterized protein (DUF1015 family)
MPQLIPLRGLRYTESAGPLADLLAPPYDVISPVQRAALAARNPRNAVELELAEGGEERYARVAGMLEAWQHDGALARDPEQMLYVYEQTFTEAGQEYTRRALIAGIEAQPWEEGAVKPHEFTMTGPKEDRLKLLQATRTQFSPVFMIARDRAGQLRDFIRTMIASRPADHTAETPDGDTHRLWCIEAGRYEMRHLAPLLPERVYIADGHHRYETAVNYRNWLAQSETLPRDHPARFALTAIVAADDPGLVIRPIHRMVPKAAPGDWRDRLAPFFTVSDLPEASASAAESALRAEVADGWPNSVVAVNLDRGAMHILRPHDTSAIPAATPSGHTPDWGRIVPNTVRYGILNPLWDISDDDLRQGVVSYTHEAHEIVDEVLGSDAKSGFLLSPVTIGEVMLLADQGERMPQKSTFFHPKLGTGLVFHPLFP